MPIFLFLSLIVAAVAVIFSLQNTAITQINFLFWSFEGSLALVLLVAVALGVLISFLATLPTITRSNMANRSLRKRITDLESSVADQKLKLDAAQQQLDEFRKPKEAQLAEGNGDSGQATPGGKQLWQG
jgi:putative membrane protein